MSNIIRAVFEQNSYTATATRADEKPIWQWNYGQILQLHGLDLPKATEVHFSHSNIGGDALIRIGTTTDKITEVAIPESFLEHSGKVTAYVYCSTVDHGQTEYKTYFRVEARAKPEAWDKPEDAELFHEAIEVVNEAAGRAETAAGNAAASAEAAHTDAGKTTADRTVVEQCKTQAIQAAENVLLSENAAGLSQEAAQVAQGQAELYARQTQDDAAKTAADRVATGRDREAVAQDKTVASDAAVRSEAAESRVEEMLSGAEATITELLDATTQGNMTTSGLDTAIKTAETSNGNLTDTVTAADAKKQELDGSIATATVKLDSLTQQNATAATNIEALRSENFDANEILTAVGEIKKYANAITGTAHGTTAVIHDTWAAPILDLGVCGKSVQKSTTGAQLLNIPDRTRTWNGVTSVVKDGIATLNGTVTVTWTDWYVGEYENTNVLSLLPPGTYTATDCVLWNYDGVTRTSRSATFTETEPFAVTGVSTKTYPAGQVLDGIVLYPMLNAGSTSLPWEPYTGGKPSPSIEYPLEIMSVGDSGSVEVVIYDGRNLIAQSLLTRGAYLMANGSTFSDLGWFYTHYIEVGNNTSTVCSGYSNLGNGPSACFYDSNKNHITGVKGNGTSATAKLSIPANAAYIRFSGMIKDLPTIKLEFGNKITDWTPAPEDIAPENAHQYNLIQVATISTPSGLPGIETTDAALATYTDADGKRWICDEIDVKHEKHVQRVKRFIANEESSITDVSKYAGVKQNVANFRFATKNDGNFIRGVGMCNCLGISERIWTWDEEGFAVIEPKQRAIDISIRYELLGIDSSATTQARESAFKNYLKTHNMDFLVALETPVEIDLTAEEIEQLHALESYKGTTMLYTTDPIEPEVTFTCVKDSNRVIENLETQHAEDIIDLQAQIDALTAQIG